MRKLFLLPLFAVLSSQAQAQIDPKVHEKCLAAADYKGCIEIFTGAIKDKITPGTQNIKLNIDTQVASDGNQCPSEFAYAGGGYCRRVVCVYAGLFGAGHHPDLAGKGMKCHKGIGQMKWGEWDKEKVRASTNELCPAVTFEVGWNNTCAQQLVKASNLGLAGNYYASINIVKPIADKDPGNWLAVSLLAHNYFQVDDYQTSIKYARLAMDAKPLVPNLEYGSYLNLALALEALTPNNPESLALMRTAVKLQPRLRDSAFLKEINSSPKEIDIVNKLLKSI